MGKWVDRGCVLNWLIDPNLIKNWKRRESLVSLVFPFWEGVLVFSFYNRNFGNVYGENSDLYI
jgi:hypothetical protein